MKASDIPENALSLRPTPVPTKLVPDWDAMHKVLTMKGFVIIESDQIRTMPSGAEESILVKAFNSHLRLTKNLRLKTKRISAHRWYCTL